MAHWPCAHGFFPTVPTPSCNFSNFSCWACRNTAETQIPRMLIVGSFLGRLPMLKIIQFPFLPHKVVRQAKPSGCPTEPSAWGLSFLSWFLTLLGNPVVQGFFTRSTSVADVTFEAEARGCVLVGWFGRADET